MAGRGRGRGGQSLSFNLPSFGSGESMPSVTLQPPPLYPMLQHRVTPLSSLEVDEYMLALSQEFRGSIRDSPFYLKEKICKKDIVRYTDRYKQTQNIDANTQWQPDWRLFPDELKPKKRKRNVKEPQIKSTFPKKTASNPKNEVSTDEIVLKLELKEEIEKEEGEEKGEEKENENEDEEGQDEEEEIDVSEDLSKKMEGYEAEFVGEVPSDMECGICLFVVREPVQIMACGHRFCSNCFDKLKKSGGRLRCPKDMDSIDLEKVFLDKAAQRAVANLMVKCFKTSKGCTWQGCLQELEKHGENCLFNDNHSLTNQEHIFNQLSNLEEAIKKKDYDLLNLKNENFRLEQEFIKYKNETTSFINNINTTLNNLLTSHHGLAARLQRLEELKEGVQKLEVKKKVNNLPLIPQNPKPNFIWKINRRSGSRQTSPSFYSADKGYLCQLKARKSLHLSLNILKGEHDERLKWPFNMRVEFVSFNKYSSQKHSLVYPLQKKTEKLSPLAHASYEYAVFLTPAVLNSCLVDDVVTVECYITDIAR